MEIHQYEPFSLLHQRPNKDTQTRPTHPPNNELSRVRQLINQIIVYKDTTGMMNHMNAYIVDWTGLVDSIKIE
jgi:polysaccharide deacetylase 2 family uncharacterized protein YibQ